VYWTPRRHWSFSLSAAASLQEQATDQIVPTGFVVVNAPQPSGVTVPGGQLARVESIVASSESRAEEYRTESVAFTATRQLTQRSFVFASVYWYAQRQESGLAGADASRRDNLTLWIGLDWAFQPIRF
jgi:hypothetical protein